MSAVLKVRFHLSGQSPAQPTRDVLLHQIAAFEAIERCIWVTRMLMLVDEGRGRRTKKNDQSRPAVYEPTTQRLLLTTVGAPIS